MKAGKRDKRIVLQRKGVTEDDYGGEDVAWTEYARAWAAMYFGTGEERREAAQQGGAQTATFEVLANAKTRALSVEDRVLYPITAADPEDWPAWEIRAIAEVARKGVSIVATRVVS